MALQLFKIQSIEVASPVTSVTFSSIPQGYTDLILEFSSRSNYSSLFDHMAIFFNGDTGNNYTTRWVYGDGSSVASGNQGATNSVQPRFAVPGASATANTFGNGEMYLSNYTGSNHKSQYWDTVTENNASTSYVAINSGLWSNTAAITSIQINPYFGSWVANSTFTLYGVL